MTDTPPGWVADSGLDADSAASMTADEAKELLYEFPMIVAVSTTLLTLGCAAAHRVAARRRRRHHGERGVAHVHGRTDNPCRGLPGLRQIHHGPVARAAVQGGRPAEWFYEQQRPHPMAGETPTPASSWQDYFAARLARWSRLSQRVRSSGTVSILESAWLQGPVFLMLHRDLDRGLIKAFILKTVAAMRGADPALTTCRSRTRSAE